jgi:hypothetical protein
MPHLNQAQRTKVIERYGASALSDAEFAKLPASFRLDLANVEAHIPDPVPVDPLASLTAAQREYLGDRKPSDLTSPGDLENFAALGGEAFQDRKPEPPAPAAPAAPPPDPYAGLSPARRLDILEYRKTLTTAADERARGVPMAVRKVRPSDEEHARLMLGGYA